MSQTELEIPLFPLHTVLFPGAPLPVQVFEPRYKQLVADCLRDELPFGVVLIKEGQEVGETAVPHAVGCTARIVSLERQPDGLILMHALGEERFRILSTHQQRLYLTGRVMLWPDSEEPADPAGARTAAALFRRFLQLQRGEDQGELPDLPERPGPLSCLIAAAMPWPPTVKQGLLEAPGPAERLQQAVPLLRRDLAVLRWVREHAGEGRYGDLNLN